MIVLLLQVNGDNYAIIGRARENLTIYNVVVAAAAAVDTEKTGGDAGRPRRHHPCVFNRGDERRERPTQLLTL